MTFLELFDYGREKLKRIPDGEQDARTLLLHCFSIDMAELLSKYTEKSGDEKKEELYKTYIEKRYNRIPLQHITNEQYFCGLKFYVDENVLIPRQDTEVLVQLILEDIAERQKKESECYSPRVLDLCTGSGCIAVSLKKNGGLTHVFGSDISRAALEIADKNAADNGCDIIFFESNMFDQLTALSNLDIIVSNPPYIPTKVIDGLMDEVKNHEPRLALDGDLDGLHFYRIIAENAGAHLRSDGTLYLEIGFDQAEDVTKILSEKGFTDIEVFKDLAGLDRVVRAKYE